MAIGTTNIENVKNLVNLLYPVGSIYMNANSDTLPAILKMAGTWEKIENKFLLSSSSSYTIKSTGGEATHTLTTNEMPSHNHGIDCDKSSSEAKGMGLTTGGGFVNRVIAWVDKQCLERIAATGGGAAHNNMPPYLSVAMWKRTA